MTMKKIAEKLLWTEYTVEQFVFDSIPKKQQLSKIRNNLVKEVITTKEKFALVDSERVTKFATELVRMLGSYWTTKLVQIPGLERATYCFASWNYFHKPFAKTVELAYESGLAQWWTRLHLKWSEAIKAMRLVWTIKREDRIGELYMRFMLNSEGSWRKEEIMRGMYSFLPTQVFIGIFIYWGISLVGCVLVFLKERIGWKNCIEKNGGLVTGGRKMLGIVCTKTKLKRRT